MPFKVKLSATRKRRIVKRVALFVNIAIIGFISLFILDTTSSASPAISASQTSSSTVNINPLDQASSADIALTVAQASQLPEYTAVANQAQSAAANEAMASDSSNVVSKPEVVTTALKSRADISYYTTVAGDTVSSLAQKFGVTSSSIMWSNGLTNNGLNAGQRLVIPPVNGIVYTVKAGDTTASLAQKYGANEQQIIYYNDAEIGGIKVGEQIIIPNGQIQVASYSAPSYSAASWGGPTYGYNGYDFGYCTWYVATQVAVPSNWGNASSWAYYASLSGWNVSTTPTVGSIAQTALAAGGEGHVAIVDGVNGSMIHIRDMNNYGDGGGWGRVGSGWVSASSFQHFISP
ncbi:MAG TPA: LysM peptidoglycan-binding domain-containing protein [Candidatus Saccharimonadales bacterium]|nr:LysM peptidoglycan-binding domain-containing protein [Candidatus Saccharimonadales bacterium]